MQRCRARNGPCRRARSRPSPNRCLHRSILCFSFVLILGIIGFAVGMVSYFSPPIQNSITAQPMDTRIVPVTLTECGELEIRNESTLLEMNLYILYKMPAPQPGAVFSVNSTFVGFTNTQPDDFAYSYYLLPGSSVNVVIYLERYDTVDILVTVYLFNEYVDDKCPQGGSRGYVCSFSSQNMTCAFPDLSITSESEYYISFCFHSAQNEYPGYLSGLSTARVNKLVYKPEQNNIRSVCTAPCSEEILNYDDYVMMATSNITENVSWLESVDFYWQCSDIREVGIWVSFVMLLSMFFVMLSIGFIVALCVVLCIRKRTESEESELLIPSGESSPVLPRPVPPPQYTEDSENSLRSPPPYTELPQAPTEQDK